MKNESALKEKEFEVPSTVHDPNRTGSHSFDLSRLRLSQNFSEKVGVKKALLTVPVRKPGRQDFIRVYPGEGMCIQTAVLELKGEGLAGSARYRGAVGGLSAPTGTFGYFDMPVLLRLAEGGMVCTNAYAPSSWTAPSMASLFTSVNPINHGVIHGIGYGGILSPEEQQARGVATVEENRRQHS